MSYMFHSLFYPPNQNCLGNFSGMAMPLGFKHSFWPWRIGHSNGWFLNLINFIIPFGGSNLALGLIKAGSLVDWFN